MKSLQEYLNDNSPGFVIARDNMPQIKDQERFKKFLSGLEIEYVEEPVFHCRPSQHNFEIEKVEKIITSLRKNPQEFSTMTPIIVATHDDDTNFVLDGHHRWLAIKRIAELDNLSIPINAIKVFLPINKLLHVAMLFNES